MDLHEDWESPGYYLYEQFRDMASIGPEITRRVFPDVSVEYPYDDWK